MLVGRAALVLVACCGLAALSGGCAAPEPEAAAVPSPSSAVAVAPDGLSSVVWPSTYETVAAAFDRLPETIGGFTLYDLEEPDPEDGLFEFTAWYEGDSGAESSMFITAEDLNSDRGRLWFVPWSVMNDDGPSACEDAAYSSVFEPLYDLKPRYDPESDVPQRDATAALRSQMEQLAQAEDPGGLIWIACTLTWDPFSRLRMPLDEAMRVAVWSDSPDWAYFVSGRSAEDRSLGIETLMASVTDKQ